MGQLQLARWRIRDARPKPRDGLLFLEPIPPRPRVRPDEAGRAAGRGGLPSLVVLLSLRGRHPLALVYLRSRTGEHPAPNSALIAAPAAGRQRHGRGAKLALGARGPLGPMRLGAGLSSCTDMGPGSRSHRRRQRALATSPRAPRTRGCVSANGRSTAVGRALPHTTRAARL